MQLVRLDFVKVGMTIAILIFERNFLRPLRNENWISFLSPSFKKAGSRTDVVWLGGLKGKP